MTKIQKALRAIVSDKQLLFGLIGIAIVLTVITFYMLGDGLNHVLNPKHISGGKKWWSIFSTFAT